MYIPKGQKLCVWFTVVFHPPAQGYIRKYQEIFTNFMNQQMNKSTAFRTFITLKFFLSDIKISSLGTE